MIARTLLSFARPHLAVATHAPRASFSKFSSTASKHFLSQSSSFSALSRATSTAQTSPFIPRAFSLSQGIPRSAPVAIPKRGFLSSPNRPAFSEVLSIMKLKAATMGTWFIGGSVVLVIVNVVLRGVKSFMDMSLEQAANYGLMLGSCSTAFAVAVILIARRRYAIDAVPVFKSALSRVQKETQVLTLIGRNVAAVKSDSNNFIKAYEIQQPSWVIQDRRLAWAGGFVKMIFPIKGSTGSAVVSVYATKEAGSYVIRQLGIQTVFADDIHLTGDPNVPLAGRELMIFEAKPKTSLKHI